MATIKFKNFKKRCVFFVVPGNGQALLGIPDTAVINIINVNIDSIQKEIRDCKTNRRQEMHADIEDCTNKDAHSMAKQQGNSQQHQANKLISYFYSSNNTDADKSKSNAMTQRIHETYGEVFNGIWYFEGTFSLQLKLHSKPYQAPPRHVAYALQKPFKELQRLQELDIIMPLGVDETAEWCISFVLVPKANGKVWLCLDPAGLNQALIGPIHRSPMLNDILLKLNNVQYMSIIDVSSGYHNLKLDKQSSYLTTFACPFGRYRYKRLPFGAVLAGDMFQHKIDEIFNDMQNVFGIADDILVIGYNKDGADHDEAVYKQLKQCQDVNLKVNKEKCHFRCMSIPFFGEVVSRQGVQPDPQKVRALTEMPAPKNKKELQAFLGIINFLNKFSPGTLEACEPLRRLTSSKAKWTWNESYQQLFNKAKSLIKTEMCMKFYDDTKPLYLKTDASVVSLGAALLQLRDNTNCPKDTPPDKTILCPIVFASKSLTGAERRYSNIECEALGILHGLEKFHHYCFGREVLVITDHKLLVSIFKKDVATLSQGIQHILLKIHQYRVQIIYKPGPNIFIADWLLRHNHAEGKDQPIKGMELWVDIIQTTTDMPECLSVTELQQV